MSNYENDIMDLLAGETPKAKYDTLKYILAEGVSKDGEIENLQVKNTLLSDTLSKNNESMELVIKHEVSEVTKNLLQTLVDLNKSVLSLYRNPENKDTKD